MSNIQSALRTGRNHLQQTSESAALDADLLLCHVLKKQRAHLRAWPEKLLNLEQIEHYQELLEQRRSGQPIAYLTGSREFWSRDFFITPDVLIPRPETELLIELILAMLSDNQQNNILDLGTGSGAIAVTLAAERPHASVIATDICSQALKIARKNARYHQLNNIRFYLSNWFEKLPSTTFAFIVSNPPYIESTDAHLQQGDLRFEPEKALISAQQGLQDISVIINNARPRLESGGFLFLEHGYNQQQQVQEIFNRFKYTNIRTYHDLAGHPRVTSGQWPG
jgi:release factor glutamine methyltransferase